MTNYRLSFTGAVAAALLSASFVVAQTAQTSAVPASSSSSSTAKPSPYQDQDQYQGVSHPPTDDAITTSVDTPAQQPAPATPASAPAPTVTKQATPAPSVSATAPSVPENPDAEIVETPVPPPAPDDSPNAGLRTRTVSSSYPAVENPDAEIVIDVPAPPNTLPEGTTFRVRMLQDILAEDTQPGTPFRAQLTQDVLRDGRVVIPIGSELRGKIVYATSGRRISGQSIIHLRPDEIILPDGTHYHLHAQVIDTLGSDTRATDEGNIVPKDHVKRTAIELAAGSGTGAVVGAKVGGGVGALVGSAVGAGVVTAHWLLEDRSADLPIRSTVVFSLTDPMLLSPSRD